MGLTPESVKQLQKILGDLQSFTKSLGQRVTAIEQRKAPESGEEDLIPLRDAMESVATNLRLLHIDLDTLLQDPAPDFDLAEVRRMAGLDLKPVVSEESPRRRFWMEVYVATTRSLNGRNEKISNDRKNACISADQALRDLDERRL